MIFDTTIEVDAAPETVWAVMREVERWPEWTETMTTVRPLAPGPLAVGSRVAIRQPRVPPAEWTVTELEPNRGFTWVSTSPGARVVASHQIEPRGSGSRVTLSVDYRGPLGGLVGWLLRNLNRRYLEVEAQGLKRRSEERVREVRAT